MSIYNRNKEPYPYNLLMRIFSCEKNEVESHLKTKDIEDVKRGIEFAFCEAGGIWKEFLLKYYNRNMTLSEIANEYNFSRENANRIVKKYTSRIRYTSSLKYIIYGYNGAKDKIAQQKDFNDIRIQEVEGLSFRTLNALKRAGVKTLADIQSRKQLFEMRSIGEKSINEITQSLNKYGKQIN